jgi:hypothetical protein
MFKHYSTQIVRVTLENGTKSWWAIDSSIANAEVALKHVGVGCALLGFAFGVAIALLSR